MICLGTGQGNKAGNIIDRTHIRRVLKLLAVLLGKKDRVVETLPFLMPTPHIGGVPAWAKTFDFCYISSVFRPSKTFRYPFDMLNRDASFLLVMSDP